MAHYPASVKHHAILYRPKYTHRYATDKQMIRAFLKHGFSHVDWLRVVSISMRHYQTLWIDQFIYSDQEFYMARAKSEWQFIDVKLETEDKPKLEKFAKEYKLDVEAILTEISAMGYKLSISYVDKQNSFVVSVSGNDRTKHNNGCTMTSWSDDVIEALFMAAYKVIVVTDRGIWSEYATDTSNWG